MSEPVSSLGSASQLVRGVWAKGPLDKLDAAFVEEPLEVKRRGRARVELAQGIRAAEIPLCAAGSALPPPAAHFAQASSITRLGGSRLDQRHLYARSTRREGALGPSARPRWSR